MNEGLTLHTAAVCERVSPWRLRSEVKRAARSGSRAGVMCIFLTPSEQFGLEMLKSEDFCSHEDKFDGLRVFQNLLKHQKDVIRSKKCFISY